MKNKLFVFAAILSLLGLSSCIEDDGVLYYNLTEFGMVKDASSILSDEGAVLTVTDKMCEENLDTMKRILFVCDVTKKLSDLDYEITLKEVYPVKEIQTVLRSSPEAAAVQYDDPVYVSSSWFSGGYLNLALSFFIKNESKTPHSFLLVEDVPVFDEEQAKQVDVNLRLYHQGGGESFANPDLELTDLHQVNAYVSIPIEHLDPYHGGTPENGMLLRLGRLWHTYDLDDVERTTKMYYSYGEFNQTQNN